MEEPSMSTNPYYGQEGHGPYQIIGIGELDLEEGGKIPDCQLAVATFGALNAAKANAILIPTCDFVLRQDKDRSEG
jgi:homoserine O-acetyltransferase